ncbi:MAG: class I SAM-dependent methyltransferase [Rhodobacteraceae bacterium]|nr:class I SAM-dependent methyltransferase [Paracoccaceae bacterium]
MDELRELRHHVEATEGRIEAHCAAMVEELKNPSAERDRGAVDDARHRVMILRNDMRGLIDRLDGAMRTLSLQTLPGRPAAEMREIAAVQTFLRGVRYRYLRWAQIDSAVQRVLDWQGAPLLGAIPDPGTVAGQQLLATDAAFRRLHGFVNQAGQDDGAEAMGCFADIPLHASAFAELAHAAMRVGLAQGRVGRQRFLDVGCGCGLKLIQAVQFFAEAHGVEYDPGYAAAARQLIALAGCGREKVFEGDALEFDDYGQYDVIYMYRPLKDETLMTRLEDLILTQAAPGTVVIAPYSGFQAQPDRKACARIEGELYLVGATEAEAETLRTAAERFLPANVPLARDASAADSYLAPIIAACWLNGCLVT